MQLIFAGFNFKDCNTHLSQKFLAIRLDKSWQEAGPKQGNIVLKILENYNLLTPEQAFFLVIPLPLIWTLNYK